MSWTEIPGGALTDLPVASASTDDLVYVFVTGTDKQIYVNQLDLDGNWTGWSTLRGDARTSQPVAATRDPIGRVTVAHIGQDGQIYQSTLDPRGWTPWRRYDDETATTIAAALVTRRDAMHTFQVGRDKHIYMGVVSMAMAD